MGVLLLNIIKSLAVLLLDISYYSVTLGGKWGENSYFPLIN